MEDTTMRVYNGSERDTKRQIAFTERASSNNINNLCWQFSVLTQNDIIQEKLQEHKSGNTKTNF